MIIILGKDEIYIEASNIFSSKSCGKYTSMGYDEIEKVKQIALENNASILYTQEEKPIKAIYIDKVFDAKEVYLLVDRYKNSINIAFDDDMTRHIQKNSSVSPVESEEVLNHLAREMWDRNELYSKYAGRFRLAPQISGVYVDDNCRVTQVYGIAKGERCNKITMKDSSGLTVDELYAICEIFKANGSTLVELQTYAKEKMILKYTVGKDDKRLCRQIKKVTHRKCKIYKDKTRLPLINKLLWRVELKTFLEEAENL